MFNLEKAHFILEEMVMNGSILEVTVVSLSCQCRVTVMSPSSWRRWS